MSNEKTLIIWNNMLSPLVGKMTHHVWEAQRETGYNNNNNNKQTDKLLMEIINKQAIIGIEKNFIWAKLRAIAQETQIQEALELCSDYKLEEVYKGKNHKVTVSYMSYSWSWQEVRILGLPWWFSGKESTLQCGGRGFDPWSGNWDPTCSGATKPTQHNYWARAHVLQTTELTRPGACTPQLEKRKPALHN